jgi:hypothetical protein
VRENDFQAMFPIGKVLSHLQQVHASMDILAWLYQISMCCPNVELLHMREAAAGHGALSDFQDYEFARYLGDLTLFKKLTALELNLSVPGAGRGEDAPVVWDALAELTRLRSLGLWGVAWDSVHGVLQLTALQSLTHLQVAARDPAHSWGDRTTFSVADEVRPATTTASLALSQETAPRVRVQCMQQGLTRRNQQNCRFAYASRHDVMTCMPTQGVHTAPQHPIIACRFCSALAAAKCLFWRLLLPLLLLLLLWHVCSGA